MAANKRERDLRQNVKDLLNQMEVTNDITGLSGLFKEVKVSDSSIILNLLIDYVLFLIQERKSKKIEIYLVGFNSFVLSRNILNINIFALSKKDLDTIFYTYRALAYKGVKNNIKFNNNKKTVEINNLWFTLELKTDTN